MPTLQKKETILNKDIITKSIHDFTHFQLFDEGHGAQHGGIQGSRKVWGHPS
jgi:hypothetical protein